MNGKRIRSLHYREGREKGPGKFERVKPEGRTMPNSIILKMKGGRAFSVISPEGKNNGRL